MKKKETTTLDLAALREKLWQVKRDISAGKHKNVREVRVIRADIARALTAQNSKKAN